MSEYLQPGQHPDPDSLNAFIEGVLPEHERMQCLAHLAECPSCREVVYLAEASITSEPSPVPVPVEKISFWKRWLAPIPALSAVVFAATLLLSFGLYLHLKSIPKTPELVAIAPHTTEPAAAPEMLNQPLKETVPALKVQPQVQMAPAPPREKKDAVLQNEAPSEAATASRETAPVASAPPPLPRAAPLSPAKPAIPDAATAQTGIAGTITDAAGAAVSGAAVKLHAIAGSAARNSISDPKGQFNVAGLEPGRYEMQVVARGFKQETQQVNVQPNQVARADSTLSVGSVAESISVTAASAQVQTEFKNQPGAPPLPTLMPVGTQPAGIMTETTGIALPSKLPVGTTVVGGKVMLATDSAGTLFLSQNAGKKWKAVKAVWHGKAVSLVALPVPASSSDPAFQLTSNSGAIWLSRDGNRWYAAAAQK